MTKNREIKKLGEVCEVVAGQSPEGKYYNSSGKGLPFYQGKKEFTEKYLGAPTTWTTDITKEAQDGDILMSVRAPVGPVNFSTSRICIGRGLAAIRVSKYIDKEFLFNFLIKHENEIVGNTGAVFNSISKTQIEDIPIPLPPISEQKRIVAILDETFVALGKAKENAEKNLQNARELFESYLQSVFANPRNGWEENRLGEVCDFKGGSQPPKDDFAYKASEGYIRLIQIRDYKTDEKKVYILIKKAKRFCDENDVMIGRYGPPVFQILRGIKGAYNVALMKAIPKERKITKEFVYFYLQHRGIQQYVINLSQRAVGQTGISKEDLEAYPIYFPNINKQCEITDSINLLLVSTKKLEAIYQQKLADLEELKKSILQKAFYGELAGACA